MVTLKGSRISRDNLETIGLFGILVFTVLGGIIHPVFGLASFFFVELIKDRLIYDKLDAQIALAVLTFVGNLVFLVWMITFEYFTGNLVRVGELLAAFPYLFLAWGFSILGVGSFILWKARWRLSIFWKIAPGFW